jgi:hypothetical protein
MPSIKKLLQAAAGNAGESLYVEDVFSTYLYTGTGSAQTITNGIDLDGEGGLVWIKKRNSALKHLLYDTERGIYKDLNTNDTSAEDSASNNLTAFNSNGFSIGDGSEVSSSSDTRASWTFRKAEKFFDVVTYTGNGVAGRTVAHNLGSVPACMIVKRTNAVQGWAVYHVGMDATNPENWMMRLNSTDARSDLTPSRWNDTAPTSTDFTLSDNNEVNGNGDTYVAYLFASDAGGFGDDGSENIIKCGSYTVDGSGYSPNVELGFEPQWVLMKPATVSGTAWVIMDTMRGWVNNGTAADDANLRPNVSDAEAVNDIGWPYSTGFYAGYRGSPGSDWIYIAIRRPMKTPESGTEVFMPTATSGATGTQITTGFASDLQITKYRPGSDAPRWADRLRGFAATDADTEQTLYSNGTDAEVAGGDTQNTLWNTGFKIGGTLGGLSVIYYSFKRATGFFDMVAYSGSSTLFQTYNHNLGVEPEMFIVKCRNSGTDGNSPADWYVAVKGAAASGAGSGYVFSGGLNKSDAVLDDSTWGGVSSTTFTPWYAALRSGPAGLVCQILNNTYIAYLFATLAGVSKVGSYTGTGADLNVDCGFSAGARFILIKRTDSTGDWYVWDSARGIVAGNDPYFLLNSAAGEVTGTDYIDPLSSGFTVTSSAPAALNASGGTYIFLAIA